MLSGNRPTRFIRTGVLVPDQPLGSGPHRRPPALVEHPPRDRQPSLRADEPTAGPGIVGQGGDRRTGLRRIGTVALACGIDDDVFDEEIDAARDF